MVRKLAGTLATVGMLSSPLAFALGLGEAELLSSLNQPFKAKIQLDQTQDVSAQDIRVQLADERAFAKAGLDREFFLQNLTFNVRPGNSGPYIELSSSKPVKEPFLNFLLQVEWPQGQLMREYTFLLDPPTYNNTQSQPQSQQSAQAAAGNQPMPSPVAGSLVEEGAKRIKIGPTDTLWSLARENRPDNRITIKQAMLAIQDANPDAFPTGNINNMEAGSTILIPNRSAMTSRSELEAIREVARQNKRWVASKAKPAPAPEPEKTATEDSQPLKLVAEDEATSGSASETAELKEELALSKESLDQSEREKAELSGRLDELQKQVNTLQKLIRLKDEQLAAMEAMLDKQNQLLSGKEVSDNVSGAEPAGDETSAPQPPKASTASAATTGQVNAGAIGIDLAAEAEKQQNNQASEENSAATESQTTEPEAGEQKPEPVESFSLGKQEAQELEPSSFLMDTLRKNAVLIGGGVAAVLALVLLMLIMRRRRKAAEAEKKAASDDSSDLMAGAAGGVAGAAAFDAMSDDDLPEDLSLDDELSSDLDESDLTADDEQPTEASSADEFSLDDLGEADAVAEAPAAEDDASVAEAEAPAANVEDLGDIELDEPETASSEAADELLDFDLGDLDTDPVSGDSDGGDDSLDLDDELNLDDLDFSEDFDLGDLDETSSEDKAEDPDSPFVQAELTTDTLSAEDADSGESVQDNLKQPETEDTESLPETDTSDLIADAEPAETTPSETDTDDEGLIDLEGEDLSDLDLDSLSEDQDDVSDDDDILAELADEAAQENLADNPAADEDPGSEPELSELDDLADLDTQMLMDDLSEVTEEETPLTETSESADQPEADPKAEAIDEAQAYRELGQPEQAAAILQRTLGESPEDNELRLNFMEVLVDLGDEATFDHELRQLQETGDAKALGEALNLQQELYSKVGSSFSDGDLSAGLEEGGADDLVELDTPDTAQEDATSEDDYDLDLSRELDALERDFERYAEKEEPETEFELEDLNPSESPDVSEEDVQLDDLATDLSDLELPLSDTDDAYDFSEDQQALRSDTQDYIDDLGDLSMSASSDDALELGNLEDLVGRDLEDDDIVDLSPDIGQDDDLSDLGDLSDISFDWEPADSDQLNVDDLLDENDDPEIKLDLARAYMDMGNTSSALEALQDVLQRGDATQKAEAGELIGKLQS